MKLVFEANTARGVWSLVIRLTSDPRERNSLWPRDATCVGLRDRQVLMGYDAFAWHRVWSLPVALGRTHDAPYAKPR